jgi:hypothetical protein
LRWASETKIPTKIENAAEMTNECEKRKTIERDKSMNIVVLTTWEFLLSVICTL